MRLASRERFVIDPVWKLINRNEYERLWKIFSDDCKDCGFIGFDMEWSYEKGKPTGSGKSYVRPKQVACPVATVQLSSLHVTFVVKFIDLFHLVTKGKQNDPFAPFSKDWPNYRIGEKKNSVEFMAKIYEDIVFLLQSDTVAKVGVGIAGDQIKFQRDYKNVLLSPCVDLVALAARYPVKELCDSSLDHLNGVPANRRCGSSLKAMCVKFAGRELNKDLCVVMSNWGGALGALSKIQIDYAAADAEASFDVCKGILVQAGLVSEDVSSPSSISGTSCFPLLEPLFKKPTKITPNELAKALDCLKIDEDDTTAMSKSST